MKNHPSHACWLLSVLVVAALKTVPVSGGDDGLAVRARAVLQQHCFECHNGPGSAGGDVDFLNRSDLVDGGLIDLEDPASSYLVERIEDQSMPPLEQRQHDPIDQEELDTLRAWIADGAPDPLEQENRRERVGVADVFVAVRSFLEGQAEEDRDSFRFFTLHYQHNDTRLSEADLRLYRAALAKALNCLSWSSQIVNPVSVPLGPDIGGVGGAATKVVFAIDLRDLRTIDGSDWAQAGHWGRLAKAYPYGLSYVNQTGSEESALQSDIRRLVDPGGRVLLPVLRADWFVATATRPPLYHGLLGLPKTEAELMTTLEVDPLSAVREPSPARFARAGFTKSGVSNQNRLLERLTSKHGSYWRSYDFLPSTKRSNLRRFPLGPIDLFGKGKHPFPDLAFEHDGGEIIFQLPNGLDGYLLIDGRGRRIDAGPIDVVSDSLKTSGTPEIVNGVSCMACHSRGMIDFSDEVRDSDLVFGEPARLLRELYPSRRVMDRLVEQDRTRYLDALSAAVGSLLLEGEDSDRDIAELSDPVGKVAHRYRVVYLDAEAVARELDLPSAETLRDQLGTRNIRDLRIQHLVSGDGVVSRAEWEASDGRSLAQDIAARLGLTPVQ